MKLNEIATQKEIVLVCGNLCSGKGIYCQQKYPDYKHIVVSTIVKKLTGMQTRSELSTTEDLDREIVHALINEIGQYDKVIIDGIRQPSILHALESHFGDQIKDVVWLDVPEEKRRTYFKTRASAKDDLDFDTAHQTDKNLGIEDVEHYIRNNHRVEKF
jgi:predicted kinase